MHEEGAIRRFLAGNATALLASCLITACGGSDDVSIESTSDASADASRPRDAASDRTGHDAPSEAGGSAGHDAGRDAGHDAKLDGPPEAGDAGLDDAGDDSGLGEDVTTPSDANDAGDRDAVEDAAPDADAVDGAGSDGADVGTFDAADAATDAGDAMVDASDATINPVDAGPCPTGAHSIGPLTASASADLPGIGTRSWDLPGNARVSDNLYARISAMIADEESHYLVVSDFAFGVPEIASITGIVLEVERKSLSNIGIADNHVKLFVNGSVVGQDRAAGGIWSTAETVVSYGSPNDAWGTALTPAIANAANFGAALSVRYGNTAGNDWPYVDRMRVTVHYVCP